MHQDEETSLGTKFHHFCSPHSTSTGVYTGSDRNCFGASSATVSTLPTRYELREGENFLWFLATSPPVSPEQTTNVCRLSEFVEPTNLEKQSTTLWKIHYLPGGGWGGGWRQRKRAHHHCLSGVWKLSQGNHTHCR